MSISSYLTDTLKKDLATALERQKSVSKDLEVLAKEGDELHTKIQELNSVIKALGNVK